MDRDDAIVDYMQNRMPPDTRAAFEAEMETDPKLAAEVAVMQAARADMSQSDVPVGAAAKGWKRLSGALDGPANTNRPPAMQFLQIAAAMVLAVGVWHFAVIPSFFDAGPSGYQTASAEDGQPDLSVLFNEAAPIGEISTVLTELEGVIIGGPSALGTYLIRFADAEQREAALEVLKTREDLFSTVLEQ